MHLLTSNPHFNQIKLCSIKQLLSLLGLIWRITKIEAWLDTKINCEGISI